MTGGRKVLAWAAAGTAFLALPACGFTPVYATHEDGARQTLEGVYVASIAASETATPLLERALARRTMAQSLGADYGLYLRVKENAQQLAVQIDDSVTRYNYRMRGSYVLVDRRDGARTTGAAEAVVSFNVVSSQYSTLFAEKAAREKAARVLVEEVERDILLKLAEARRDAAAAAAARTAEQ